MVKIGAAGILTTVFLGLFAWAGNEITSLKERAATLETSKESIKENLIEIKGELKESRKTIDAIYIKVNSRWR